MLKNIIIASALMVVTTGIHAGGMLLTIHSTHAKGGGFRQRLQRWRLYWVSGIVLLMFLVSLAEVLVWAVTYLVLDAIHDIGSAVYFSMVTFTTLGYGDIVLPERWRLLASFEAANGIIMFGWTTAIVLAMVQHIYFNKNPTDSDAL